MRKAKMLLLVLLAFFVVTGGALAMSSAHYQINWQALGTGGGAQTSSTHYTSNYTIGQTAIAASSSTHYKAGLGYWQGVDLGRRVYLPVTLKRAAGS